MANPPPPPVPSRALLLRRMLGAGLVFGGVLAVGMLGYAALGRGRWSLVDALYMSVITLSTVGYGELEGMDEVAGARLFTMLLILAGTGALLYLTSALTAFVVEGDLRGALRRRTMDKQIDALNNHVILAGLGATGSHVAQELDATGQAFVVLELNPDKVDRLQREQGLSALHLLGDATDESVLEAAGIQRAKGLIAALADDRDNLFLTFTARGLNADLRIVAKAVESDNHTKIRRAGADDVISPTSIGGRRLVNALMRPSVVGFVDHMLNDREDPHRIDDVAIEAHSPLAGLRLLDSSLRNRFDALVIAIRLEDGRHLYNPGPEVVIQAGMTLIVMVPETKVSGMRDAIAATAPTEGGA